MIIEEDIELDKSWYKRSSRNTLSYDRPRIYLKYCGDNVILDRKNRQFDLLTCLTMSLDRNVVVCDPSKSIARILFPDNHRTATYRNIKIRARDRDHTNITTRRGNRWGSILLIDHLSEIKDAEEETEGTIQGFADLGVPIKFITSPARMFEEILSSTYNLMSFPNLMSDSIGESVLTYAINCFRGGRMEAFMCGKIDEGHDYDFNSAYFSVLKDIPSLHPFVIKWKESREYIPEALFGFCKCYVTVPEDMTIGPVANRLKIGNRPPREYYIVGRSVAWRTKAEIDLLLSVGAKVVITTGYWGVPISEISYPFRKATNVIENAVKNPSTRGWAKSIASMSWGKFASPGSLWNPIYSAYITSEIRCAITRMALRDPDNIVAITVDGLMSKRKLPGQEITSEIGGTKSKIVKGAISLSDYYRHDPVNPRQWNLTENGVVVNIKFRKVEGNNILIPYGSSKRLSPVKNLTLSEILKENIPMGVPTPEDAVSMYFTKKDFIPIKTFRGYHGSS